MTAHVIRADTRRLPLPDASVLGYLAGIIDADGCILITRRKPRPDAVSRLGRAATPQACDLLWQQSRALNRVGIDPEGVMP